MEAAYIENHAGLPLTMRIFFGFARYAIFLIVSIAFASTIWMVGQSTWIGLMIGVVWLVLSILGAFPYTRLDIFFRPGFHAFSWLYTVRK